MENRGSALVTGGNRGIGKACALKLADAGFDVCITYRSNGEQAVEVKKQVEDMGRRCVLLQVDISDTQQCAEVLEGHYEKSAPDVLVLNAGVTNDNLLLWMKKQEWDQVLRTNLDGFYNMVRPLLFNMLRVRKGRIIVISSVSGEQGQAGQVNYSAAKAGLIGAAKALAREVGKKGILVNVVSPGIIETDMTEDLPKKDILPLIPLNRTGRPEEVASVVNFLAAEEDMYIHGQVIGVNGGLN